MGNENEIEREGGAHGERWGRQGRALGAGPGQVVGRAENPLHA
jgi:hypothetical protein